MVETDLRPFDLLVMVPVIEGAGGIISNWEGGKLWLDSMGQVAAVDSLELHAELLLTLCPLSIEIQGKPVGETASLHRLRDGPA